MVHRMIFPAVAAACCLSFLASSLADDHRSPVAASQHGSVGGSSASRGKGAKASVPVRIKNVGRSNVRVNAASGAGLTAADLKPGFKTLSRNGVAQFLVRKGDFTAVAGRPGFYDTINSVRGFNTGNFKTYYLRAQASTTAASIVGAPPGVKF